MFHQTKKRNKTSWFKHESNSETFFMDLINVHDKAKTVDVLVKIHRWGLVAARESFLCSTVDDSDGKRLKP
jgi:hypothetical protein